MHLIIYIKKHYYSLKKQQKSLKIQEWLIMYANVFRSHENTANYTVFELQVRKKGT